jgi:hypothetical protein
VVATFEGAMNQPEAHNPPVVVSGTMLLAIGQACINLSFFVDDRTQALLAEIIPEGWYPLDLLRTLLSLVATKYVDPAPILEQIGMEIITIWYAANADTSPMNHVLDFLHLQTSSAGYYSLVQGDPRQIGEFTLVSIDEQAGTAMVRSTTPFPRALERGILRAGVKLPPVVYVDVEYRPDESVFLIEFH